jgi:guanine deaminase
MGAIIWCGMGRVVYAASIEQLSKRLVRIITSRDVTNAAPFLTVEITGGVLALFDNKNPLGGSEPEP